MTKKNIMTPGAIKTILNSAPLIIQGTGKLIQMIRERNDDHSNEVQNIPMTVEGLKASVEQLEQRLDGNDESNVEQIKLIEQLAKQNEALAESLKKIYIRLNLVAILSAIAIVVALISILRASV
ncbi:MAG: hypothetical protein ACE5GZ_00680 [Gammaproteobacteria bacterium]